MAGFAAWWCIRAAASSTRSKCHGNEITAGVGAKLKQVAYAGKAAGLGGLEWMEGIPGAVGGGLRMNAGAMGSQTFENVVRVRYLDGEGKPHDENARSNWKCITVTFRRWKKIMRSLRCFAATPAAAGGNRAPPGGVAGETTHDPAEPRKAPAAFSRIRRAVRPENWWTNWA